MRIRVKDVLDQLTARVPEAVIRADYPICSLRTSRPVSSSRPHNSTTPSSSAPRCRPVAARGRTDAQAVREIGKRETEDDDIWNHALATGAVIVTKDEDFTERAQRSLHGPVIIWLRIGNCTNPALRQWFMPRLPRILNLMHAG